VVLPLLPLLLRCEELLLVPPLWLVLGLELEWKLCPPMWPPEPLASAGPGSPNISTSARQPTRA
jgi:hypothetical protein